MMEILQKDLIRGKFMQLSEGSEIELLSAVKMVLMSEKTLVSFHLVLSPLRLWFAKSHIHNKQ